MEINRITSECTMATLLTGLFCQLLAVFRSTSQLGEFAYFSLLALVNISTIAAIYYLKRGKDLGELMFIVMGVLVGLWIGV